MILLNQETTTFQFFNFDKFHQKLVNFKEILLNYVFINLNTKQSS